MVTVRFIIGLMALIFFITFGLLNMEPSVTLRYYFGYTFGPLPLFFALLCAAAVGIVVAMVFSVFEQLRLRSIIRGLKREVVSLKLEIDDYRQSHPEHVIEKNLSGPDGGKGRG